MSSCGHDNLTQLFQTIELDPSPSEVQGTICGMLCVQLEDVARLIDSIWFSQVDLLSNSVKDCRDCVRQMVLTSEQQLTSPEMGLRLYLPDDESNLQLRKIALIDWCEGFLFGVGLAGSEVSTALSDDATAVLQDFVEITRMDTLAKDEGEESEQSLAELIEYTRLGAYLLFDDCKQARKGGKLNGAS